jgi:hypothetical protein
VFRFSQPRRRADQAGQLLLSTVTLIVTLPLWLAWLLASAVLIVARPFIVFLLGFATLGGAGFGAYFALTGQWSNATQAGLIAGLSGAVLAAYVAFMDHIGIGVGATDYFRYPPWWWSF